jgi:hypothetical protein
MIIYLLEAYSIKWSLSIKSTFKGSKGSSVREWKVGSSSNPESSNPFPLFRVTFKETAQIYTKINWKGQRDKEDD